MITLIVKINILTEICHPLKLHEMLVFFVVVVVFCFFFFFFLGVHHPNLTIESAQNDWNYLDGPKTK